MIVPDENEARVARMRELRRSGMTYAAVADTLHAAGWRTKRGGRCASAAVQGVLKRPTLGAADRRRGIAA